MLLKALSYISFLIMTISSSYELSELVGRCMPFDHCGDEGMNITEIISTAKEDTRTELTEYQRWAIALGAMTAEMNRQPHGQLSLAYGSSASDSYKQILEDMLYEWWGITDRDSTLDILSWLGNTGHSQEQYRHFHLLVKKNPNKSAEQILDKTLQGQTEIFRKFPELKLSQVERTQQIAAINYVKTNMDKTGNNLIYAWDYGRFVFVARAAYTVDYLSKAEALALIEEVGKRVRIRFHSWQEFGDNYVIGRKWWAVDQPGSEALTDHLYSRLTDPTGEWTKISWDWSKK